MSAWELVRAVYSLGLLALGVAAILAAPGVVRVLRDLAAALAATATALRALTAEREAVERIEATAARIETSVAALRAEVRARG